MDINFSVLVVFTTSHPSTLLPALQVRIRTPTYEIRILFSPLTGEICLGVYRQRQGGWAVIYPHRHRPPAEQAEQAARPAITLEEEHQVRLAAQALIERQHMDADDREHQVQLYRQRLDAEERRILQNAQIETLRLEAEDRERERQRQARLVLYRDLRAQERAEEEREMHYNAEIAILRMQANLRVQPQPAQLWNAPPPDQLEVRTFAEETRTAVREEQLHLYQQFQHWPQQGVQQLQPQFQGPQQQLAGENHLFRQFEDHQREREQMHNQFRQQFHYQQAQQRQHHQRIEQHQQQEQQQRMLADGWTEGLARQAPAA